MIYAYDQWAQMPTRDIYDTQMMAMAINAAKDMYDEKKKDLKDFEDKYADFYSPFQKDMERYNEMMNNVRKIIDSAYDRGIDVLRSPEGSAIINQAKAAINPAEYNAMRLNAKYGEEYRKALAKLRADGRYSQDMENYRLNSLGLPSFDEFSTSGNNGLNTWSELSPTAYKSLQELTENWYNKRTPYQLTADKAKQVLGKDYDPRAKYTGFLDEDLMKIAGENAPGFQGSFYSDYYRDLAKRQVAAEGGDPNDEKAVEAKLQRNIADTQQKWIVNPIGDLSDWKAEQQLNISRQQLQLAKQNRQDRLDAKHDKEEKEKDKLIGWTGRRQNESMNSRTYNNTEGIANVLNKEIKKMARGEKHASIHDLVRSLYLSGSSPVNGYDLPATLSFLTKASDKEVVGHVNDNKKLPLSFSSVTNDLHLTSTRAYYNAAQNVDKNLKLKNPLSFENWLQRQNVTGYLYDDAISTNYDNSGGLDVYDINGQMMVKKSSIMPFFNNSEDTFNKKAGLYGIKKTKVDAKTGDGVHNKWIKDGEEYVIIPVTRTISADYVLSQHLNTTADAIGLTPSKAADRESEYGIIEDLYD